MRRNLLGLAALWICVAALSAPARASSSRKGPHTDVEGVGYFGRSSGFFGCGEQGRLRYAGGGARIRHSMRDPKLKEGMGAMVSGAALLEFDQAVITNVDEDSPFVRDDATPGKKRNFGVTSLDVRTGYYFPYVGMEIGINGWLPRGASNMDSAYFFPNTQISIGSLRSFHVLGGLGAPHLSQIRSWGPYVGVGMLLPREIELQLIYSHFFTPQTVTDRNVEALWYVPIRSRFDLRASYSAAFYGPYPDHQTSIGLRVKL